MDTKDPDGKCRHREVYRGVMVTRRAILRKPGNELKTKTAVLSVSDVITEYMRFAIFTIKDNMADDVEERENYEFSFPTASSKDSETEVVIRREILDTFSAPEDEINAKLAENFHQGFENWANTFDVDRESHIESVKEKAVIVGSEKSVRNENTGNADYEKIAQYESRTKAPEIHGEKSPEVEFRHRCLQQQQQQQQEKLLSSRNEEAIVPQSNNKSFKSMEEKSKLNKNDGEVPSIKKTACEEKLDDGFTSESVPSCSFLKVLKMVASHVAPLHHRCKLCRPRPQSICYCVVPENIHTPPTEGTGNSGEEGFLEEPKI